MTSITPIPAVPSVSIPAADTGFFFTSPQYTSALSYMETCLYGVDDSCSTATVVPCFCSAVSNYVSSINDCLASGNSIVGTTLWDLYTDGEYITILSEECSDVYTITPYSVNTMRTTPTTPHATAIPTPIFEPVSISIVSSLPTTTYPTQSVWAGTGTLLAGYCASPEYTLVNAGPTVWWAPVIGCHDDKPDCCPSSSTDTAVSTFTSFVASTASTITVTIEPSGQGSSPSQFGGSGGGNMALDKCPADYQSVSGGCCPSGYQLWNAAFGHGTSTPCFSTLPARTNPPPIFELSSQSTAAATPTSAVVNIVYAVHYPVKGSNGLPHSTIVGIAVGCTFGALLIGTLILLLLWYMKKLKKVNRGIGNTGSEPVLFEKAQGGQMSHQQAGLATTDPVQQVKGDVQVYTQPDLSMPPAHQGFQTALATVPPNAVVSTQIPQPAVPLVSQVGSPPLLFQVGSPPPVDGMSDVASSPVSQMQELHDPHWAGRHELQSPS